MSLVKTNAVQIGQSATASQNFTITLPTTPDGTLKISRGNAGATTSDAVVIDANDKLVISTPTLANHATSKDYVDSYTTPMFNLPV